MLRSFMDSATPANIVNGLRDKISYFNNIIRIETQLKSFKAINDPQNYKDHKLWKELVELAIKIVAKEFRKEKQHNLFLQIEKELINELKPLVHAFLMETN